MKESSRQRRRAAFPILCAFAALFAAGCKIGPDYVPPEAPTAEQWIDHGDTAIRREPADLADWWTVFDDPVLDHLIETAWRQNPSLHAAAIRILEAQAARGIAFGLLFPQQQAATGSYTVNRISENRANFPAGADASFQEWQLGVGAAWEIDLWGRFRRGVESADAEILSSVASYDDVLVSLIAEVASNYIFHRALEERLAVARSNVQIQTSALEIARTRSEGGTVTELDAAQAASLLYDTEALIPSLEASIRQTEFALCILLGMPPRELSAELGGTGTVPSPPESMAVGVPADLLRRRPDIRRAESEVAAQCARIGVAKADLLPAFSLVGNVNLSAEDIGNLFEGDSVDAFAGPSFQWFILNYGRITNNVRVEDARFQALIAEYESTVLRAQGEVEGAIAGFLGAQRQVQLLAQSVAAASRAVEIADLQYRGGTADYTRVLNSQQFLATEQDRLATTRGLVALNIVELYRALGGGWEMRESREILPQEIREEMEARTGWGGLLAEGPAPAPETPPEESPAPAE